MPPVPKGEWQLLMVTMNRKRLQIQSLWRGVVRRPAPKGFTLIEILVAIAIFSVSILGLGVGAVTVMKANKTSYLHTIATNLAQDRLEIMKAMTVGTLTACSTSSCDSPQPTFDGVAFTRKWAVAAGVPAAGFTQITVTVEWTDYAAQTLNVTAVLRQ